MSFSLRGEELRSRRTVSRNNNSEAGVRGWNREKTAQLTIDTDPGGDPNIVHLNPWRTRMPKDQDEEKSVRERAYQIWQQNDQPEGKHQEHWDQAENERKTEDEMAREKLGGVKGSKELKPAPMTPQREKKTPKNYQPGHVA
jgi:Protein of unknown function (DUF2934)